MCSSDLTVATNAVLERKGARTALITTAGFEDVLEIGRQTRRELYNLDVTRPAPLVPSDRRFGISERILHDGSVEKPLNDKEARSLAMRLKQEGIESVAVSLLFSFVDPSHERRISDALREHGFSVSLSCDILPEYREYERTSTTVVNAYVAPIMHRYLTELSHALPRCSLRVMQSKIGRAHV